MMKLKDGNAFNVNIPTYYVESVEEMKLIPKNAPAGTIVEVNAPEGFSAYMKAEDGSFRPL